MWVGVAMAGSVIHRSGIPAVPCTEPAHCRGLRERVGMRRIVAGRPAQQVILQLLRA